MKSSCPYCGEPIRLVVDLSIDEQQYTEDCEVCCQPMVVSVTISADEVLLDVAREDA